MSEFDDDAREAFAMRMGERLADKLSRTIDKLFRTVKPDDPKARVADVWAEWCVDAAEVTLAGVVDGEDVETTVGFRPGEPWERIWSKMEAAIRVFPRHVGHDDGNTLPNGED